MFFTREEASTDRFGRNKGGLVQFSFLKKVFPEIPPGLPFQREENFFDGLR